MLDYSVVIPIYNEEESVEILFEEIKDVLGKLNQSYEIIFVDDCSSDRTPDILKGLKDQHPGVIRIITFPERSGQTRALKKGLENAQGEVVITMDADLQNDPADIPKLLDKLNEGNDMVTSWRKARMDKPLKKFLSKLGNVLQRLISGLKIHDVSCTLRALRRKCIKDISLDWEGQHRFIPLSVFLKGHKLDEVVSNHRARRFGYTKYSHKRVFRVMVDFLRILITERRTQ